MCVQLAAAMNSSANYDAQTLNKSYSINVLVTGTKYLDALLSDFFFFLQGSSSQGKETFQIWMIC